MLRQNVYCKLLDVNVNLQKISVNQTDVHVRSTILAVWQHVGHVMVKTVITRRFVKYIYIVHFSCIIKSLDHHVIMALEH